MMEFETFFLHFAFALGAFYLYDYDRRNTIVWC